MLGPLHPARFFGDAFREIDADTRAQQASEANPALARTRCLVALTLAAVVLTGLEYYSGQPPYWRLLNAAAWLSPLRDSAFRDLGGFAWWSGLHVIGYFALPALVMRVGFGVSPMTLGLAWAGTRQKLALYASLLALVLPVVVAVSFLGEFASYYPFYKQASRSWLDLLLWEGLYMAQFFALEFFFRGFLLAACRPVMGASAIFCAVVPYCMIHFSKPMLEALGAIFAGLVLGTLALRTRSIWGGFGVHVGVALTMDLAALLQGPGFPAAWLPPAW